MKGSGRTTIGDRPARRLARQPGGQQHGSITQCTGRRALHLAEVMRMALQEDRG